MNSMDNMPTPTDLMDSPQLAILVALDTTLVAAMRALLAVHSEFLDDTFPRNMTELDLWADRLIYQGYQLEKTLAKYRAALGANTFPGANTC